MNYQVYAVARDFSKCDMIDEHYIPMVCDLTDRSALLQLGQKLKKEDISVLVNCAGVGSFAPHEELGVEQITRMIDTNLTAPLLLTGQLLRSLKLNRGYLININSICALKPSVHGAAYGATKAGLRHFSASVFEEARKSGIKVVNINPDMTATPFFDDLSFGCSDDPAGYLEPTCVADAVEYCMSARDGSVVSEITLQPQRVIIDKKGRSR